MSQENIKPLVIKSLKAHLDFYQQSGVDYLPKTGALEAERTGAGDVMKKTAQKISRKSGVEDTKAASGAISAQQDSHPASEAGTPVEGGKPWAGLPITDEHLISLRREIGDCTRCPLHKGCTHLVFGEGNPRSTIMFVGEGPGADEDESGRPFIGRAGKLLTDMIEKGMGLKRSDIYIANVVKCRPPNNRNPEPEEIAACIPFLKKQIDIIKPKVIIALGKFASQTLLQTETPITKLRGEFYDYGNAKLMPTYHPAFLLRNPTMKKPAWEDLQKVMRYLDIPLPKKPSEASAG